MRNILFYKYVQIRGPEKLRREQFKLAKSLNLLGTILIAKEGINGCLSGSDKDLEQYKKSLAESKKFSNIKFKEGPTDKHTFRKLHVRVRDEIVSSKFNVDIKNKGKYIEPKELKTLLDNNEDLILLDARNSYEFGIGRFKGAMHLNLGTFREFPLKIKQFKKIINKSLKNKNIENLKNDNGNDNNKKINGSKKLLGKKIITYCTGGVRCEKASALLRENGFENVYQIHDGILNYGKECGNSHWEGKCFVFDTRGAIDIDPNSQSKPITQCVLCHLPNSELHNCSLTTCDKFFTACEKCFKVLEGCCSKNCRGKLPENLIPSV